MYKEQFEIVTSTSEINWYMISINEAMMSLLNKCDIDYKSLHDTVLPLWLDKYIEVGIEKREDVNCYTYKNIKKFELFYQDYTGNEFSNNKVVVDKVGNVAKGLEISLKFAFKLAELLGKFPQSFNIVISYDNMDFIVSFYCKRKDEEWLIDDLDSYTEEAIMVMTTKFKGSCIQFAGRLTTSTEQAAQFVEINVHIRVVHAAPYVAQERSATE